LLNKENDTFIKASLVLHNIITNHPFMDGNKRTGFQVAEYKCSVKKVEKWLREKVRPLHSC
jgi:fido (protein-threonine AMPylation protein)